MRNKDWNVKKVEKKTKMKLGLEEFYKKRKIGELKKRSIFA